MSPDQTRLRPSLDSAYQSATHWLQRVKSNSDSSCMHTIAPIARIPSFLRLFCTGHERHSQPQPSARWRWPEARSPKHRKRREFGQQRMQQQVMNVFSTTCAFWAALHLNQSTYTSEIYYIICSFCAGVRTCQSTQWAWQAALQTTDSNAQCHVHWPGFFKPKTANHMYKCSVSQPLYCIYSFTFQPHHTFLDASVADSNLHDFTNKADSMWISLWKSPQRNKSHHQAPNENFKLSISAMWCLSNTSCLCHLLLSYLLDLSL